MAIAIYWRSFCAPYLKAKLTKSERGASLVEYAILVAFIAIVCVGAVTFLGDRTQKPYSNIGSALNS